MPEDEPKQPEPKANESAASQVEGLQESPNTLDQTAAVPSFDSASIPPPPEQEIVDQPEEPALQLNPPAPAGNIPAVGPPQLQPQNDAHAEQELEDFRARMLKRAFNKKSRDTDRDR